ncbi:DUF881 domain-containing protein [Halobacillus rhizosphaerae]|uniref:DUF881 domain-containing protein n=1 Tax=Halobacillus rhizosphaerae TaxID=3064889 RepID=UPI00398A98A1
MKNRVKWMVSLVFLCIGFMTAIQFKTTAEPKARDTRDQWEIREELKNEQQTQEELLKKISDADQILDNYNANSSQKKVDTLKESIHKLEKQTGLMEAQGAGVTLTISPIFQESTTGQAYPSISPELLSRLVNELNQFGAEEIAIGKERLTNLSPIRNVNGYTYVNNRPLPPLPVTIQVLSENPDKLRDYIEASQSKDFFAIDNLDLKAITEDSLVLPKYEDPLQLEVLKENDRKETGE